MYSYPSVLILGQGRNQQILSWGEILYLRYNLSHILAFQARGKSENFGSFFFCRFSLPSFSVPTILRSQIPLIQSPAQPDLFLWCDVNYQAPDGMLIIYKSRKGLEDQSIQIISIGPNLFLAFCLLTSKSAVRWTYELSSPNFLYDLCSSALFELNFMLGTLLGSYIKL